MAEDSDRNVFIVRIWREPRESPAAPTECRGLVEHIASGQRRYFRDLSDLEDFLRGMSCFDSSERAR